MVAIGAVGILAGVLGLWLFLCDQRNEFAPLLLIFALACLLAGSYFGA